MVTVNNDKSISRIILDGRIDSTNAQLAEKQIFEGIDDGTEKIIIDAENLEFISSAGLRVILKLRKAYKDIEIVGVSPDVYDVFEMTGFTEMLDIQKG